MNAFTGSETAITRSDHQLAAMRAEYQERVRLLANALKLNEDEVQLLKEHFENLECILPMQSG